MSARLIATRIIQKVLEEQQHLSYVLAADKSFNDAGDSKALIQEICYGTLRWYIQLDHILVLLMDKPVKKKDSVLKYLLLSGLYQMKFMRIPPHAVVSETVSVCRKLKKESAKGLVNAILRRYQRESEQIEIQIKKSLMHETASPKWFNERLQQDWPEQYTEILAANNRKPPMFLRVNQQKTSRDDYLKLLQQENIDAVATAYSLNGIELATPCNVEKLPGFNDGWVSVQDLAAQLACQLLQLERGQVVLDACAAPGGKSAHILEACPELEKLILVEKDAQRTKKIRENLSRLQLTATVKVSDLLQLEDWWDGQSFDRILLDAPCSATGVIRRHPDIKLLRTSEQVTLINELQQQLLTTVWQILKPQGLLVYATCSVLKQENSDTIRQFLTTHNDCDVLKIQEPWGIDTDVGKQILTGMDHMDGFFYAVLSKKPEQPA